jgi:hypothetical protein
MKHKTFFLFDTLLLIGSIIRHLDKHTDITFLIYDGADILLLRHYEWTIPENYEFALGSQTSKKRVFYLAEYSIDDESLDVDALQKVNEFKHYNCTKLFSQIIISLN